MIIGLPAVVLQLRSDQLQEFSTHAERAYPEECCGLLLGEWSRATQHKTVVQVWAMANAWDAVAAEAMAQIYPQEAGQQSLTKQSHYWIDPSEMLKAQRYARQQQLEVIGIYHSHPDHRAAPSECDRRCAWSHYSYVILSVQQGTVTDCRCWILDDQHQFQAEEIIVVEPGRS